MLTYHFDIRKIVNRAIPMAISDGEVLINKQVMHTVKSLRVEIA